MQEAKSPSWEFHKSGPEVAEMTKPGPKPRPTFQVVREGNPSHRRIEDPVVLPPCGLVEPDWTALLLGDSDESDHVRATAAEM